MQLPSEPSQFQLYLRAGWGHGDNDSKDETTRNQTHIKFGKYNTNDIDLDTTYLTKCPVVDLMQHEPSYFEIVAQGWHHRSPPQHSLRVKLFCRFHSAAWWIETAHPCLQTIHWCCSHAKRTSPLNHLVPLGKTSWTPCRHSRRIHSVTILNSLDWSSLCLYSFTCQWSFFWTANQFFVNKVFFTIYLPPNPNLIGCLQCPQVHALPQRLVSLVHLRMTLNWCCCYPRTTIAFSWQRRSPFPDPTENGEKCQDV